MAKFTASSLGIVLDATSNTEEVEVNFWDVIASEVRSDLIRKNETADGVLAAMKAQVKALESEAWEQVKALLEPAAERIVLGHLAGINAISAGEHVYNLLEAVNRQFALFTKGKNAQFDVAPKGWKSYTVNDGKDTRWLPEAETVELEALRKALPEGFLGMPIAKQRTIAAKAMAYDPTSTKTFTV